MKGKPVIQEVSVSARSHELPSYADQEPGVWSAGYAALVACLMLAAGLVAYYLWLIIPYIQLPADLLMWAETNFVGDIIKIRTGVPVYTPPADGNSLIYTPGAPLLTYAISWIIGMTTSIPTWRAIQLGYVALAALLATSCCEKLLRLSFPGRSVPFRRTWYAFSFLTLLLAATSPGINRYVHCLHNDALALLVSVFSFWAMVRYAERPGWSALTLMAVCPALGYLTKQLLLGWAGVMFVFLLLHDPRNVRRLVLFTLATSGVVGFAIGGCYLLWGDAFLFWTFEVMGGSLRRLGFSTGSLNPSVARALDHTIRAWMELAVGGVGVCLVLSQENIRRVGPLAAAWLSIVLFEGFFSGAGWATMYHFGPGGMIGCIWFLVALVKHWPVSALPRVKELPRVVTGLRLFAAIFAVFTLFVALRVVPTKNERASRFWPPRHPSRDVQRYIADIEREFEGLAPDRVLLDVGNWVYLRDDFLAKHRAVSLGDQPVRGIYENFEPLLARIRNQEYEKILLHDLRSRMFLYDWAGWPRSSGVRRALDDHYQEVRTIAAAAGGTPRIWFSGPVSVLVPRQRPVTGEDGQ